MKKLLAALALLLILFPTAAQAVELNSDTGFDNAGAWMLDPATSNGWAVSGSKAVATNVTNMRMLMGMSGGVKRGHKYRYSLTVSNYSGSGILRVAIGHTMSGTAASSYILASSVSAIADNFTTANGLGTCNPPVSCTTHVQNEEGTPDNDIQPGAWRITCEAGPVSPTDPVVYPGQYGASHLHQFYGNIGAVDPNSTYASLRAKGSSTCGDLFSPNAPINRSGYWHPAMMDGAGHVVKPDMDNLYYKRWASGSYHCKEPNGSGDCVNVPVGLRMIVDGAGWRCRDNAGNVRTSGGQTSLAHMDDWIGTCLPPSSSYSGDILEATIAFPQCWDGVNIDSPTHRTHVASGFLQCTNPAYPYHLPHIELQIWWAVDANYVAGKWHLSSDEMTGASASTSTAGTTIHADYVEGWSRNVLNTIETNCWNLMYTCSAGDNGDGTYIKDSGQTPWGVGVYNFATHDPLRYVPLNSVGMSREITANGTYTGQITAVADGKFSLLGLHGLNASVDNFSIVEVPSGHKGPVTVGN